MLASQTLQIDETLLKGRLLLFGGDGLQDVRDYPFGHVLLADSTLDGLNLDLVVQALLDLRRKQRIKD